MNLLLFSSRKRKKYRWINKKTYIRSSVETNLISCQLHLNIIVFGDQICDYYLCMHL